MANRFRVLMASASVLALSSAASAQNQAALPTEEVVVTGSRVVSSGDLAPTPVTVLGVDKLLETSPANIPEALMQLPEFATNQPERVVNNAGTNPTGAFLNLRQLGVQRNLVLLDGIRLAPAAASGAVDVNVVPQSLVQRVDIVTGGASAVYGSDAVSGVINFVLDHNFTGLKMAAQGSISTFDDDPGYRFSVTAGSSLFGGRGHLEATFDHYDTKGIGDFSRPGGNPNAWTQAGLGTPAAPYYLVQYGRLSSGSPGGLITSPGPLFDINFTANGVPSHFVDGLPTTSPPLEIGGDGSYQGNTSTDAPLNTSQFLSRFDYEVTPDVHAWLEGSWNQAKTLYDFNQQGISGTILSGDPFIPSSVQDIMTANKITSFTISKTNLPSQGYLGLQTGALTQAGFMQAGLDGDIFGFHWNTNYTYSRTFQRVTNYGNQSAQKKAAALDAVTNPANGNIVCQVSLTQYASLYPNCLPINPFGPTAPSVIALAFTRDNTQYTLANVLHDANGTISGPLFSLPGGPLTVALSAEYRSLGLKNVSNAQPSQAPDCTGLRVVANCSPTVALYGSNTTANMQASENTTEVALEAQLPLLSDVTLVKSLEVNLAGRYTDYSVSGGVETWKIGGIWDLTDEYRLRTTYSDDIRAPTLTDLYLPVSTTSGPLSDIHTGLTQGSITHVVGNPNLVPEVARTVTAGVVWKPEFIPGFSAALDWYRINMTNAISSLAVTIQTQQACEASNGTSPYCALVVRPLPFSDHSAANFPLYRVQQGLNVARVWTGGFDLEINYATDLDSIVSGAPGALKIRFLGDNQPVLNTLSVPGLPVVHSAGVASNTGLKDSLPKWRSNLNVGYTVGDLSASVVWRWQSGLWPSDRNNFSDLRPDIPDYSYIDVSASYKVQIGESLIEPFATVQNLFNVQPPILGSVAGVPGLNFPAAGGFDVIGRYYTIGVRGRF